MNASMDLDMINFIKASAFISCVAISIFVAQLLFNGKGDSKAAEKLRGFVNGMLILTFISLSIYLWFYAKA